MGNRVKEFRTKIGMSQADLANKCDTTRQTIIRIEQGGTPKSPLMFAIARTLGGSVDEIFSASKEQAAASQTA